MRRAMKRALFVFVLCCLAFGIQALTTASPQAGGEKPKGYTLEEKWATEAVLKVPESVKYDAERKRLYVANINGMPTGRDGDGFISIVSMKGDVVDLEWVGGLDAPKGMGINGGTLYVTDIDDVVEIDIEKGGIAKRYPADGAVFLNDIDTDADGNVYISDMSKENSVIYRLSGGKLEVWLKGGEISSPNGLYVDGEVLVVGNSGDGKLKAVDLADKTVRTIADIGTGIDGVEMDRRGNYILSDWSGRTMLVGPDKTVTVLRDTREQKVNAADIEFIKELDIVLIPTFFDNRVVAVELKSH